MDARMLQAALRHLGLRPPHGLLPGSYPGGLIEVAADEAAWDAYAWNPPQHMREGAVCRIGPWAGLRLVPHPRSPNAHYNEFAYREAAAASDEPAPHESAPAGADAPDEPAPDLPEPTGADALPGGWSAWPAAFPAWSIGRFVYRVPAERALDEPDPDAAPKPTWAALVEAERAARLGALPAALIAEANAHARARIASAYVGRPDRIAELTWRLNGRASPAQDAERARLVAVCHGLEARIRAAGTIEALEAIDVASDAVWSATEGGENGEEG